MRQLVSVLKKKKTLILQHTQNSSQKELFPKCKWDYKTFLQENLRQNLHSLRAWNNLLKSIKLNIEKLMFVKMWNIFLENSLRKLKENHRMKANICNTISYMELAFINL